MSGSPGVGRGSCRAASRRAPTRKGTMKWPGYSRCWRDNRHAYSAEENMVTTDGTDNTDEEEDVAIRTTEFFDLTSKPGAPPIRAHPYYYPPLSCFFSKFIYSICS